MPSLNGQRKGGFQNYPGNIGRLRVTPAERQEAVETLRKTLPEGAIIYTVTRYRNLNGEALTASFLTALVEDGALRIVDIDWLVRRILGLPYDKTFGGLKRTTGGYLPLSVSTCVEGLSFHVSGGTNDTYYEHQEI